MIFSISKRSQSIRNVLRQLIIVFLMKSAINKLLTGGELEMIKR